MNELQQLADLIRRIQAGGDVGPEALAEALINEGVRVAAEPRNFDTQARSERISHMVRYASSVLRKPGSAVNQAFHQATPEVRAAFEEKLRQNLDSNPYFYLGMQATGELVRAVGDTPDLAPAYGRMSPAERSTWVSSLRDMWHAFAQAAEAFGLPKL